MDVTAGQKFDERTGSLQEMLRPIFQTILKKITNDTYTQFLTDYPENFVTDDHKRALFPGVDPDWVSDKLVAAFYLNRIEEGYIKGMFYMYAAGIINVISYAVVLSLVHFFIIDISLTVVGIAYNFLGALTTSRLQAGPAHLTVQLFAESHTIPLLEPIQERINNRLREQMGFMILTAGFMITFLGESGIIGLIF